MIQCVMQHINMWEYQKTVMHHMRWACHATTTEATTTEATAEVATAKIATTVARTGQRRNQHTLCCNMC